MLKPLKTLIAAGLLIVPATVSLHNSTPTPAPMAAQDAEPTALQQAMGTLKSGQRAVKKLMADQAANRTALLETLGGMEAAALTALGEQPPAPEEQPESSELWMVGYKQQMATLLQSILSLEEATLRADADALAAAYAELSDTKKTGHREFRDS